MRAVFSMIGLLLAGLAITMLIPAIADPDHATPFLVSSGMTLFFAVALHLTNRPEKYDISSRQAYLLTSGAWVLLPLFAALPFTFFDISFTDSVFESISGITTTGSTILSGLDNLPPGLLLWRALLQWAGGIGFIVTSIAILPLLRVGGMQLFRTESSDRADKELPRATMIAGATLWVYAALSAACALAYLAAGMTGFDAITHAMTTVSTGGYSTHDASMGFFANPAIHWIAAFFMLSGGLPFVLYIRLVRRGSVRSVQVRSLLIFLLIIIAVLTLWLLGQSDKTAFDALTLATFNVISVVTTTGYATTDYTTWGSFAVVLFFMLTFSGACTGSTSGGLKAMRIIVALKVIRIEMHKIIYPHGVFTEKYEDKTLTDDVMNSVGVYIFLFFVSFVFLTLVLQMLGLDFETSISGAATALANVGPGIGSVIGPAGNFASLPDAAKWALGFGMLLGRLEFFTLLVLFTPGYWRS